MSLFYFASMYACVRHAPGKWMFWIVPSWVSVRREKVQFFSRCNSYPAKVAPAGSYRSGGGGNETVEAFETTRRLAVWRVGRP